MRLLFLKHALAWPRSSGHDVHCSQMMRACAALGHDVSLVTITELKPEATEGLALTSHFVAGAEPGAREEVPASWLQRRFRRFYGIDERAIDAVGRIARRINADAVVAVGLDVLPYFPALPPCIRVWYAADEWLFHHLSQVRLGDPLLAENLREALVKGLYERAHRGVIDRVWVVTQKDSTAMRWVSGIRKVDILPNGVDGDHFQPGPETAQPHSAVFWGRLDFGPNMQGLEWFITQVWPRVRQAVPDARFDVVGFHPVPSILKLAEAPGVSLFRDVPDLRSLVRSHQVAVLPFQSGLGIKNKLLEAAAMGMPIVGTSLATRGLRPGYDDSLIIAERADAFADALVALWKDEGRRNDLGTAARRWVLANHSWKTTAEIAMAALTDEQQIA